MKKQRIIRVMRKLSGFIAALPLIFSFILSYFQVTPVDTGEQLAFDKNGEFVILIFSGLLEGEQGFKENTKKYINNKINEANPDFVILGGNNIYPQPLIADLFLGYTLNLIDEYSEIFNNNKVYFTALFGDYDTKALYDKSSQMKRFMKSEFFVGGIKNNNNLNVLYNRRKNISSNYRINITFNDKVAMYLYIIDYQKESEFRTEQIQWFRNPLNIPSVVFSYDKLYQEKITEDNEKEYEFMIDDPNIYSFVSFGGIQNIQTFEERNLIETGQSSIIEEGVLKSNYTTKKIVLHMNGGLSIVDI